MKIRHYTAFYDDGHDYGEFTFSSCHKANSKPNLEDAKTAAKKKYGYKRANCIRIVSTQIAE